MSISDPQTVCKVRYGQLVSAFGTRCTAPVLSLRSSAALLCHLRSTAPCIFFISGTQDTLRRAVAAPEDFQGTREGCKKLQGMLLRSVDQLSGPAGPVPSQVEVSNAQRQAPEKQLLGCIWRPFSACVWPSERIEEALIREARVQPA